MIETSNFDPEDWVNRWDMDSVPDFDDKVQECEFFFELLSREVDRKRFRWLLSGFLNAAYSFFESTALMAYFRHTDSDGGTHQDDESLAILRRHVGVIRSNKNPDFVKTSGLTTLTKKIYEIRKKNTHHFPISIMIAGPSVPNDFHIGDMRGDGIPALLLCRDALHVIQDIYTKISE